MAGITKSANECGGLTLIKLLPLTIRLHCAPAIYSSPVLSSVFCSHNSHSTMKREPSIESQGNPPSSPSHSSPASGSYVPSPAAKSPPKKRAKVKTEAKPNVATSSRRARDTWTADKCAELIELVITEGLKKGDVDGIAATVRWVPQRMSTHSPARRHSQASHRPAVP